MNIALQRSLRAADLDLRPYALVLCGNPIDDRGRAAIQHLTDRSLASHTLDYDAHDMQLSVDGHTTTTDDLTDRMKDLRGCGVALETTTLGFVEILLCCRALHGVVDSVDCLYVEPKTYRRARDQHLLAKRDFELSGEITGFRGIPGTTKMLDERAVQRTVFFLGYEGARFRRAFADLEIISAAHASVVFGVPAFNAGWEMDSMANNVPILAEEHVSNVYFCGADNPRAAAELLNDNYLALQPGEILLVAPIGTKPHGLGTALFLAGRRDVGVIYDHPQRVSDRSSDVGNWHLFAIREFGRE